MYTVLLLGTVFYVKIRLNYNVIKSSIEQNSGIDRHRTKHGIEPALSCIKLIFVLQIGCQTRNRTTFVWIWPKGGFTLCNAVASNEAIEKGQGQTMLLATRLHATPLACLHYATWLQRRDINSSPGHRVAPLLHSNGGVASGGGGGGIWE